MKKIKEFFKSKKSGVVTLRSLPIIGSTTASAASVGAAAVGDTFTAWVTVIINAAILIVTAGLEIYKMIRDRDKDVNKKDGDE